jgi:hypothetical protein
LIDRVVQVSVCHKAFALATESFETRIADPLPAVENEVTGTWVSPAPGSFASCSIELFIRLSVCQKAFALERESLDIWIVDPLAVEKEATGTWARPTLGSFASGSLELFELFV